MDQLVLLFILMTFGFLIIALLVVVGVYWTSQLDFMSNSQMWKKFRQRYPNGFTRMSYDSLLSLRISQPLKKESQIPNHVIHKMKELLKGENCYICMKKKEKFEVQACGHPLCKSCFVKIKNQFGRCPKCNKKM